MWFQKCPRCDYVAYEVLRTHSCCYNCNFCPDEYMDRPQAVIPQWALDAIENGTEEELGDPQEIDIRAA